jgi:flagellar FliJ protein
MKRFRFKLESLLELRRWEEREKEIALGRLVGECVNLRRAIDDRNRQEHETFLNRTGPFDFELFSEIELFGRRMRTERLELSEKLRKKEIEREKAQKVFLEASSRRKVLDRLKEKKSEAFRRLEIAGEQRLLDEIGSNLSVRSRSGDLTAE